MPRCLSNDTSKYDGCQCDIGYTLELGMCWCSDAAGNPLPGQIHQFGSTAAPDETKGEKNGTATWLEVCVNVLRCAGSELWTPDPTQEPTTNPTIDPTLEPTAEAITVDCNGNCDCPDGQLWSCTLNALGRQAAKDATLSCGSAAVCVIRCVGEEACQGNAMLLAEDATDEMTVLCEGGHGVYQSLLILQLTSDFAHSACKGNIIDCGSVTSCALSCSKRKSCDDTTVKLSDAGSFECTGECKHIKIERLDTSWFLWTGDEDMLLPRVVMLAMTMLFCAAVMMLCLRVRVCKKAGYAKVELADDSDEVSKSEAEAMAMVVVSNED